MHVFIRAVCILLIGCATLSAQEETKEFHLKLTLDRLFELNKTWTLGEKEIEAQFQEPGFKKNPFVRWSDDKGTALFLHRPFTNLSVDLSVLDGEIRLDEARLVLDKADHRVSKVAFRVSGVTAGALTRLRLKAGTLVGGESKPGPRPMLGWKSDAALQSEMWSGASGTVVLETSKENAWLCFGRPGIKPRELIEGNGTGSPEPDKPEFFVRLDELLPVPDLWSMTSDELEAKASVQGLGLKENPFFKWNTGAKDSARFSRNLFSNANTDLLLFNDAIHAEEVNVEFTNGHASKLVVTLLSRGNSGRNISVAAFNEANGAAARALGARFGVRPTHNTPAGMMLVKTDGYLWTTPHTLALLEYNVDAPKGQVEFVRLTMTPAAARNQLMNTAGIGNFATTRNLISLMGSVRRNKVTNDVEIIGIPMRDQGQKGYCVAASCERLLKYLGQPCDMDELAQLVAADAKSGASPRVMYDALAKIDQRYNLNLALLLIAPNHSLGIRTKSRSELDRAKNAVLGKIIPEAIDHGVPVLWGVKLPPDETGISPQSGTPRPLGNPEVSAGHMRMIIGYNSKTGAVIYSDSWGAGHERKVMSLADAQRITTAAFSMTPAR